MSMILLKENEVTIGKPLPWRLYDQERKVLAERGSIVRDSEHLHSLLENGACHELSWETPDRQGDNSDIPPTEATQEQTSAESLGTHFTFDEMKLHTGSRLQLEPPKQLGNERIMVKVIGYLRGASLLVTAPATMNGTKLQLIEGEKVVMRSFSGQSAFAFACTVERVCKLPYEYLHLSFPDVIQGVMIRKAPRVKSKIIASVLNLNSQKAEKHVSALISNISANGVALDAQRPLGKKDDVLDLSFRVNLHNIDAFLSLKAAIRAVIDAESAGLTGPEILRYGLEFQNLQPNDMVILQSMIYQQLIEHPHNLV